jgi:hypothetical protein
VAIERWFSMIGRELDVSNGEVRRPAVPRVGPACVSGFDMLKAIMAQPFLDFRFGEPKLKRSLRHYSLSIVGTRWIAQAEI